MKEIKELLGDELYKEVKSKIKDLNLIIDDGKMIPKYRFDFVNLSLKEHKSRTLELENELKEYKLLKNEIDKIKNLYSEEKNKSEKINKENQILYEISKFKPRNLKAVYALINDKETDNENFIENIRKHLENLKKTDSYLFINENTAYYLIPYNNDLIFNNKATERKL